MQEIQYDDSVLEKLTKVDRESTRFDFEALNLSPDTEEYLEI